MTRCQLQTRHGGRLGSRAVEHEWLRSGLAVAGEDPQNIQNGIELKIYEHTFLHIYIYVYHFRVRQMFFDPRLWDVHQGTWVW